MENQDPGSKKTLRRSSNSHLSMSDTESTASQVDSWHSPLRSDSPFRSDDPYFHHEADNPGSRSGKSLAVADRFYSPGPSPGKPNPPVSPTAAAGRVKGWRPWPHSEKRPSENSIDFPGKESSAVVLGVNRLVREEPPAAVRKVGAVWGGGGRLEEGYGGGGEGQTREAAVADIVRRSERNVAVKKVALVLRVFELMACLVSFSVMAADKTQGWSGDSFERYLEYRYCLAVNVIGFVYSGFQAYCLAYHLGTEKHVISHHLRYHFDFSMDQMVAYLLMSASSSAATRVTDWISNWGKDEFTIMASASIAMSFLAFFAFALSSLISGHNFYNRHST
ncbi:CASP-like protein 4A3 [Striga hermonthica]|uniref:CASP-like protein n=1 Tax=Striga hermonthica TaxID=68872 RepID=A0A9N7N5A8_STRHE|nr:CASP-like protein 4A3 [Striga hermonthica]